MKEIYQTAANGDADALAFLLNFEDYLRAVEEFITVESGSQPSPNTNRSFLHLLAKTNFVYSMPYYQRNSMFLYVTVQSILNGIASASDARWSYRAMMRDMVFAVANLKLGFLKARELGIAVDESAVDAELAERPAPVHVAS